MRMVKKPSTALSQLAEVGVKWNVQRGCRPSHSITLGCLWVTIVEDGVDGLADRDLALDGVQEEDEFLMPVALHAAADDLAFQHVEGGEQGGRAVSLVVVGHGPGPTLLQGQTWLGAVEGADLGLLIDGEDARRAGRRIDVESDDVAHLRRELRVVGQLEGSDAVRGPATGGARCAAPWVRLTRTTFAITRPVQWVVSPGGSARVRATIRSATSSARAARLARAGLVVGARHALLPEPLLPVARRRSC